MVYQRRIVDEELDELFAELPAIALEGPKFVGKTTTAEQRSVAQLRLDAPRVQEAVRADPALALQQSKPLLIDEWQKVPSVWDAVRRAVDDSKGAGGQFLLTGSATPSPGATEHSGAGRITSMRMRPMSLAERGSAAPTASLKDLLYSSVPAVQGWTDLGLADYVREIVMSGFPEFRRANLRALRRSLDSYLRYVVERDIPELGVSVRKRDALLAWLRSYAAATATTANFSAILERAVPGEVQMPSRQTVSHYRELLEQIWLLDPVPAWHAPWYALGRLSETPKHHLADPALAARLLGLSAEDLLHGRDSTPSPPRGSILGNLFESLVALCLRVYAQAAEADVHHLRTRNGDHEVDFIITGHDGSVVAVEVKLSGEVSASDLKHLKWLRSKLGENLQEAVVITTGPAAYRREDGIAVIPLALLGP